MSRPLPVLEAFDRRLIDRLTRRERIGLDLVTRSLSNITPAT